MDYDAADEGVDEMTISTAPLYNVSSWRTHENTGRQCSQGRDFCYLCMYRGNDHNTDQTDENGDPLPDYYTSMVNVIKTLAGEEKEVGAIVDAVYDMYEEDIRHYIDFIHPKTKMRVKSPEYTRDSIERHILYSGIAPELHDSIVDHVFHNIIDDHNEHMRNAETKRVIEDERKAFMDTIKNFTRWRQFRTSSKQARTGCGKRVSK